MMEAFPKQALRPAGSGLARDDRRRGPSATTFSPCPVFRSSQREQTSRLWMYHAVYITNWQCVLVLTEDNRRGQWLCQNTPQKLKSRWTMTPSVRLITSRRLCTIAQSPCA